MCRFLCDRVAACGVVFVDENINLPALKHSPVKTPLPAMSAIYMQEVLPSDKVCPSCMVGGLLSV